MHKPKKKLTGYIIWNTHTGLPRATPASDRELVEYLIKRDLLPARTAVREQYDDGSTHDMTPQEWLAGWCRSHLSAFDDQAKDEPMTHAESVAGAMDAIAVGTQAHLDAIMGDQEPGDNGERVVQIATQAPTGNASEGDRWPELYILTERGNVYRQQRGAPWERIRLPWDGGAE